jgi:short subunit dehydrogenase-like uncharacterized protein
MMPSNFLLYGANGFVGEAIARLAVQSGLRPLVAGRNAARIQALVKDDKLFSDRKRGIMGRV